VDYSQAALLYQAVAGHQAAVAQQIHIEYLVLVAQQMMLWV
jgi:hypothetical protein